MRIEARMRWQPTCRTSKRVGGRIPSMPAPQTCAASKPLANSLPRPAPPRPAIPAPQANATFIEDPEMAQRLMDANPNSFRKLVRSSC